MPDTGEPRIVGISLLRNEEHFAGWALRNVASFCDEIRVLDNRSTDRTPELLAALEQEIPHLTVEGIEDPNHSHRFVESLAGTATWVCGVDGDEIYDPAGLARLRSRLKSGEFRNVWRINGYMLHPVEVDLEASTARGHITPHTPPGNKLYNFEAISAWPQSDRERLHGRGMVFREDDWDRHRAAELHLADTWDSCDLRALHLCFFPRSSADEGPASRRANPAQLRATGIRRVVESIRNRLGSPLGQPASYKTRRYLRGPSVTRSIADFGRPTRGAPDDPSARSAEIALSHPAPLTLPQS